MKKKLWPPPPHYYLCSKRTHTYTLSCTQPQTHKFLSTSHTHTQLSQTVEWCWETSGQAEYSSSYSEQPVRDRLLPIATTVCCGYVLNVNILHPLRSHWSRTKPDYYIDRWTEREREESCNKVFCSSLWEFALSNFSVGRQLFVWLATAAPHKINSPYTLPWHKLAISWRMHKVGMTGGYRHLTKLFKCQKKKNPRVNSSTLAMAK